MVVGQRDRAYLARALVIVVIVTTVATAAVAAAAITVTLVVGAGDFHERYDGGFGGLVDLQTVRARADTARRVRIRAAAHRDERHFARSAGLARAVAARARIAIGRPAFASVTCRQRRAADIVCRVLHYAVAVLALAIKFDAGHARRRVASFGLWQRAAVLRARRRRRLGRRRGRVSRRRRHCCRDSAAARAQQLLALVVFDNTIAAGARARSGTSARAIERRSKVA